MVGHAAPGVPSPDRNRVNSCQPTVGIHKLGRLGDMPHTQLGETEGDIGDNCNRQLPLHLGLWALNAAWWLLFFGFHISDRQAVVGAKPQALTSCDTSIA